MPRRRSPGLPPGQFPPPAPHRPDWARMAAAETDVVARPMEMYARLAKRGGAQG